MLAAACMSMLLGSCTPLPSDKFVRCRERAERVVCLYVRAVMPHCFSDILYWYSSLPADYVVQVGTGSRIGHTGHTAVTLTPHGPGLLRVRSDPVLSLYLVIGPGRSRTSVALCAVN